MSAGYHVRVEITQGADRCVVTGPMEVRGSEGVRECTFHELHVERAPELAVDELRMVLLALVARLEEEAPPGWEADLPF